MKAPKKVIGLTVAAVFMVIAVCIATLLYPPPPKTSLVKQPEDTVIEIVRNLTVSSNQSTIINVAEQASLARTGKQVNVTVVQTANETMASYLFEVLKAGFLAQGLTSENLSLSELSVKFYSSDRPCIILLTRGKHIIVSSSNDENLALEAAKA